MAEFTIKGTIPTELVEEFLQLLRDFEQHEPNKIHMGIVFDVAELSVKEVEMILGHLQPGFPVEFKGSMKP